MDCGVAGTSLSTAISNSSGPYSLKFHSHFGSRAQVDFARLGRSGHMCLLAAVYSTTQAKTCVSQKALLRLLHPPFLAAMGSRAGHCRQLKEDVARDVDD